MWKNHVKVMLDDVLGDTLDDVLGGMLGVDASPTF
jgi:hypothetical protein